MPTTIDSFSWLFIACFLGGLLYLIVMALLGSLTHGIAHSASHTLGAHHHIGGHAHAGHAHTNHGNTHGANQGNAILSILAFINPMTLVFFLVGFGFFGYVFHNSTQLALPFTLALAGVSGFIIAGALLALLNRAFGNSEGATVQDVSDRTGMLGKVSLPIQANGLGEILYVSPGGMRKAIPARSVDGRRMERDQEVVVVNYQHGIAEVDTWEHFINQEESIGSASSHGDDLATLRALLDETDKADAEYVMRKDPPKE